MPLSAENLQSLCATALGERLVSQVLDRGQLTLAVRPADLLEACTRLRDDPALAFKTLIDIVGVDYLGYAGREGARYAVVYNLLSVAHNARVRLSVGCASDDFPEVDSVIGIWPSANWYEREAFDLYGIVFRGHPDLRRILTDYGFVGHPFRKDFPVSGYVEMRYDAQQRRVIYEPVSIEPREVVPRVVREDAYGDPGKR